MMSSLYLEEREGLRSWDASPFAALGGPSRSSKQTTPANNGFGV
jgi:hypothetical protein